MTAEPNGEIRQAPPKTPACWAWQTAPLSPAFCTCIGCTRWREQEASSGGTEQ